MVLLLNLIDLRTFVAKFVREDLRTFSADFFGLKNGIRKLFCFFDVWPIAAKIFDHHQFSWHLHLHYLMPFYVLLMISSQI